MKRSCLALLVAVAVLSLAAPSSAQIFRRRGGCNSSSGCSVGSSGCNVSTSGCNLSAALPAPVAVPAQLPASLSQSFVATARPSAAPVPALLSAAAGDQPTALFDVRPAATQPDVSMAALAGVDSRSATAFCAPAIERLRQTKPEAVMLAAFRQR
jgi:hypothetical protein